MSGKKQLRAELSKAQATKERLQKSLVGLQHALSSARNQASMIEHRPQISNQGLLEAASTPRQRAEHLQDQIIEIKAMISNCEAEIEDIRNKLLLG